MCPDQRRERVAVGDQEQRRSRALVRVAANSRPSSSKARNLIVSVGERAVAASA